MTPTEKYKLSLAGEFGVCSELSKKGYLASLTFGNCKSIDIIVSNENSSNIFLSIEVKATRSNKFVTNFFKKYITPSTSHPDYWVFVHINENDISRFFILTHEEVAELQMIRNKMTVWEHHIGVDSLEIKSLLIHENRWDKIKF